MNGPGIFARLIDMRDQAGQRHYERIALADKLLKDVDWVESPTGGGGDEDKAINRLESECFADLCGVVGLVQLLDLYHHYPNVSDWKRHRFDLKRMWAEWRAKHRPEPRKAPRPAAAPRPAVTPAQFEQLSPARQKSEYEKVIRHSESDAQKIARLEAENAALREENARLKQQLKDIREQARRMIA